MSPGRETQESQRGIEESGLSPSSPPKERWPMRPCLNIPGSLAPGSLSDGDLGRCLTMSRFVHLSSRFVCMYACLTSRFVYLSALRNF